MTAASEVGQRGTNARMLGPVRWNEQQMMMMLEMEDALGLSRMLNIPISRTSGESRPWTLS